MHLWLAVGPQNFYPRPPRGGRRYDNGVVISYGKFLSTSSARRTTDLFPQLRRLPLYFYPRPPRGGRQDFPYRHDFILLISIHVLREEDDTPPL